MQIRQYDNDEDGRRIWLNRDEQRRLRDHMDEPDHELMVRLGLHGLRAEEILQVDGDTVREVPGEDLWLAEIVESKRGNRDVPIRPSLGQVLRYRRPEGISVDSTRSLDRWMSDARAELADQTGNDAWGWVTVHDLRRTWATELYYQLSASNIGIAEELVMSWGGWRQTASGRETFRQHYLGPVPEHVTAGALQQAGWLSR